MLPSLRKSRTGLAVALSAGLLAVTGCAATGAPSAGTVRAGQTAPAQVYSGVVLNVTPVTIRPDNTIIATGTGAVIGGIAGSTIGRNGSAGEALATVGGAILGGFLGNAVGEAAGTREGYAYTIDFGNGDVQEIVQGGKTVIQVGTPVNVIYRQDGAVITPAAGPRNGAY